MSVRRPPCGLQTGPVSRSQIADQPAPFASEELLHEAKQVAKLLDELGGVSALEMVWGLVPLTENIQLALRRPRTLDSADNQLDFIEELAEAVWREPPLELFGPAGARRPDLVESIWERLGTCAERLCERVDRWSRKQTGLAAGPGMRDPGGDRASPT